MLDTSGKRWQSQIPSRNTRVHSSHLTSRWKTHLFNEEVEVQISRSGWLRGAAVPPLVQPVAALSGEYSRISGVALACVDRSRRSKLVETGDERSGRWGSKLGAV